MSKGNNVFNLLVRVLCKCVLNFLCKTYNQIQIIKYHQQSCQASLWEQRQVIINKFVLAFYCCVTNYHKLMCLKQHPLLSHHFCRSEVQVLVGWIFCSDLTRLKSKWQLGFHFSFVVRVLFQAHVVIGRILFLAPIGLTFLFLSSCQLGTSLSSQSHPSEPILVVSSIGILPHGYFLSFMPVSYSFKNSPDQVSPTKDNLPQNQLIRDLNYM